MELSFRSRRNGIEPVLVETFVEKNRFSGTCYKAANFHYIGTTQGRGRQDSENKYELPVRDIYLYPLKRMLITTMPVNTFNEAVEKLGWYTRRWDTET